MQCGGGGVQMSRRINVKPEPMGADPVMDIRISSVPGRHRQPRIHRTSDTRAIHSLGAVTDLRMCKGWNGKAEGETKAPRLASTEDLPTTEIPAGGLRAHQKTDRRQGTPALYFVVRGRWKKSRNEEQGQMEPPSHLRRRRGLVGHTDVEKALPAALTHTARSRSMIRHAHKGSG